METIPILVRALGAQGQVTWVGNPPDELRELGFYPHGAVWGHLLPAIRQVIGRPIQAADARTRRILLRYRQEWLRTGLPECCRDEGFPYSPSITDTWNPFPYQTEAAQRACAVGRLLLGDDCGLGKTTAAMLWYSALRAAERVQGLVVFCPVYAMRQWRTELKEKLGLPAETIALSEGTEGRRHALYEDAYPVYLVNYEKCRLRDRQALQGLCRTRAVVLDEVSDKAKNPSAEVSKGLRHAVKHARYRMALTATLIENGLDDLWHGVQLLRPGWLGPRRFFRHRYVNVVACRARNGCTFWRVRGYRRLHEVRAMLGPLYLRRTAEDPRVRTYLPEVLPPRYLDVELKGAHLECYRRTLRGEFRNKLERNLRLVQASLHPALRGMPGTSCKSEVLRQLLLGELRNEKVLVFTFFEHLVQILMREFRALRPRKITGRESAREREFARRALQDGDCRLLFINAAGQRALNLQAARIVVNYDLPWNPAALKQRMGRVRRAASEHRSIQVINLVAKRTIEEEAILPRIAGKQELFVRVLGQDADVVGRNVESDVSFQD